MHFGRSMKRRRFEPLKLGRRRSSDHVAGYNYLTRLGVLVAAWDFALGVTDVGGVVDSILDQSGRGNTLTAPGAASRPVYVGADAEFNHQPVGQGDGVNDTLRTAAISMGAAFAPGSIIVVGKIVTVGASKPWMSMATSTTLLRDTGTGTIQGVQGTGSKATTTACAAAAHVVGMTVSGSYLQMYVDGLPEGTAAAYTGSTADGSAASLFNRSDSAVPAAVKIAFAAITLTELSAQQMADFATYARARWGTP